MVSKNLFRFIGKLNPIRFIYGLWFNFSNWRRRRVKDFDYVQITLPESMDVFPEQRSWVMRRFRGDPPLSLTELDKIFRRIADDPRPKGVILTIRGLSLSLADVQTLRNSITRLRESGKRVVCYAPVYTFGSYYLASAADEIILQRGGVLLTPGLLQQTAFLKDALANVGVQFEVVAISPYKGAADPLTRTSISPEGQEQLDWLLDGRYEMMLDGIMAGRGMSREGTQAMIDAALHTDQDALERGYVDAVRNEEQLAEHLKVKHLVPWERADKILPRKRRKRAEKVVAVLPITGAIVNGESRKPPIEIPIPIIGGERAGDLTVVQQVRRLMKSKQIAAVILFVDSPGGSAIASEAMASALDELAKDRPVIVYMNGVAASGGYYIATPAQWIVAQPGTITGSIGVFTLKPVTRGVFEKLDINRMTFARGANADLLTATNPLTDSQRDILRHNIEQTYAQFVDRVAQAREMTPEAVDEVGGGRVWTGKQAHERGLVDELGDLQTAFAQAKSRANLPDDTPLVLFRGGGKTLPPQLAEKSASLTSAFSPTTEIDYLLDGIQGLTITPQMRLPFVIDTTIK